MSFWLAFSILGLVLSVVAHSGGLIGEPWWTHVMFWLLMIWLEAGEIDKRRTQ